MLEWSRQEASSECKHQAADVRQGRSGRGCQSKPEFELERLQWKGGRPRGFRWGGWKKTWKKDPPNLAQSPWYLFAASHSIH